ncbi:MAG: class I SAM-dependent methyltransferase [Acidobacteria bacterium]|nr:class I SAM-dependent methyltransferase [Acidobacteriota bacterium]
MRLSGVVFGVWLLSSLPSSAQQFNAAENLAPYIPSPQIIVEKMLETARVKPGEMVYDLGSGDGRIVITAAQKFKANAVGVELSGDLCRATMARVKAMGLQDRVKIIHGNLLKVDLSPADVVTIYLLTSSNDRLRPNLEKYLKPGARVVSNDFEIRGWHAAQVVRVTEAGVTHSIYLYEILKSSAVRK